LKSTVVSILFTADSTSYIYYSCLAFVELPGNRAEAAKAEPQNKFEPSRKNI